MNDDKWPTTTIGQSCTTTSGGTPSKQIEHYWRGDIPWVSAKDLKFDQISSAALHISRDALERSATKLAPVGSLLILVRGMGLANGVPIGEVVAPVAFNQDLRAIHPPSTLLPRFLMLALRKSLLNGGTKDVLSAAAHGTLKIDADALGRIAFPVPPLPEQQRIVAILDEAFEGIATAKANAEKNLLNARELFESTVDEALSRHGGSYDETTLGAEIDLLAGYAFSSKGYADSTGGIRLLRGDNIMQGYLRWDDAKRWPATDAAAHACFALQEGDIVLAMDRPWVKAGLKRARISSEDLPCLQLQRTARLRPKKRMSVDFLHHLVGSKAFSRHLLSVQTGLGVPHISGKQIESFKFMLPPQSEQESIAHMLDGLQQSTERLAEIHQQKLALLDELKKSLLHQAFTGAL